MDQDIDNIYRNFMCLFGHINSFQLASSPKISKHLLEYAGIFTQNSWKFAQEKSAFDKNLPKKALCLVCYRYSSEVEDLSSWSFAKMDTMIKKMAANKEREIARSTQNAVAALPPIPVIFYVSPLKFIYFANISFECIILCCRKKSKWSQKLTPQTPGNWKDI